jgi:hypothetical protein
MQKHTWGLQLSTTSLLGVKWSLSIDWVSEGINDTAEKLWSDWNIDNGSGTLDSLSFLDKTIGTEQDDTDLAGFQVHAHTLDTRGEPSRIISIRYSTISDVGIDLLDELLSLDIGKTVDTGNTVTICRNMSLAIRPIRLFGKSLLLLLLLLLRHKIFYRLCFGMKEVGSLVPDGEDTTGLSETGLLSDTTDSLLEDRGDLSWRGLSLRGEGAGSDGWGDIAGLSRRGQTLAEHPA